MGAQLQPFKPHEIIYDWNEIKKKTLLTTKPFELFDETLRDGIQSPSVTDPEIEDKKRVLSLLDSLGVQSADIGLPGAGQRAYDDVAALCQHIASEKLQLKPGAAGRTVVADIEPIADIVQKTGVPLEVYAFIGSSPIRMFAEGWDQSLLLKNIDEAIRFSVKEGLEFCLVTEDTIRSSPVVLDGLFRKAIELGVRRLCLCDTVGHATPDGVRNLIEWTHGLVQASGEDVKIDWHGHNDRGLGVVNTIFAVEYGADRVHGTILGVGERVGNAALDQILLNLKLLGMWDHDLTHLVELSELVGRCHGVSVPYNYPLVGEDAFRTGTGVHAAAVIKALKKGDDWLADRVYSGVPAGMFGRRQEIEIGHMSGVSNVLYWLESREVEAGDELVQAILARAKAQNRTLSEAEVWAVVKGESAEAADL